MDWLVLGIAPTKDKKAITTAYRQKLRQTNPEDKPEEFKALRAAYEAALAYAEQTEEAPARDESPVGLWMEALNQLYANFTARIDLARWQELMAHPVLQSLDGRQAAEEALLNFLMEHFHLPKAVWQLLEDTFHFTQRVEELQEHWPREFLDHAILAGLRYDPALDLELFTPGVNGEHCDLYRQLYFQANQTPLPGVGAILEQMDGLSERHPYGEAMRYRYYMETGREQEGRDGLRRLAETYPDNPNLATLWAELLLDAGDVDQAQAIAQHILDLADHHIGAKILLAKTLAAQAQYHEAKEVAYEIFHASGENPILMEQMVEQMKSWNQALISQREATYRENPKDTDNAIELVWCYAQNERMDEAMYLAGRLDPNMEDAFGYHNLMGKLYHNMGKTQESLPHLQKAEELLRNMQDDGTEKTHKRMARLPELLQIQANALNLLGRTQEAKEKFQQALELAPEDTEVLSLMAKILFASGDYPHAVEICQRLTRVSPGAWVGEMLMAMCLYRMHQDGEAFAAVERAIAIQGNDLSMYTLKMQILLRNGRYSMVHEVLDFLRESGAPRDLATDFLQAQLVHLEDDKPREALKQYRALQKRLEAGEDMIFGPDLYYYLAWMTGDATNLRQEAGRKKVLELVDKGLARYDQDVELLDYKAWVLNKAGLREEALEIYRAMERKNPDSPYALQGLAKLYYEDLERHAGEALAYYEKLLRQQKTPELYFYSATCKRHMGDLDGARLYYLKELELEPEDIDGFRGLALICEAQGKYEEALETLDQALALMEQYQRHYDWMVEHKAKVLRRLGRFAEAIEFLGQAAVRFQYDDAFGQQVDICCQAGMWDRAEQILQHWKRSGHKRVECLAAEAKVHLLRERLMKAVLAMAPVKSKLEFRRQQDFRMELAELEGNYARQAMLLRQRLHFDPKDNHAMTLLAMAYWHMGKRDTARETAGKALVMLDEILTHHLTDEALYRSRRSLMLALVGKTEEAKAELAKTRTLPLCHFCEYGSCKDADIYEAQIEEILGNRETARELYAAGRAAWPDDLDFVSGQRRLNRKGRK